MFGVWSLEFEKRLRTGLMFRVAGFMIRDYGYLVEATAHLETIMQAEEKRMRGSKRSQDGHGDGRRQRGPNPQQSQGAFARSTFPVPSSGSRRGG